MNRIPKKLRSRNGASITFALLLFLICAIISSVVIVAGTTASGRISGMTENDQRYYAVSSAAKLIQEELDGKSVTINEVKDTSDSLPEYITYRLCGYSGGHGNFNLSLSSLQTELNDAVSDVSVNVTVDSTAVFRVESKGYAIVMEFSPTGGAAENSYIWMLSNVRVD